MSNEIGIKLENTDGVPIEADTESKEPANSDTDSKVPTNKPRSVSFNRDVHVKRFGKTRDLRASSAEPTLRKEPFTHLSKEELIKEANKIRAQAESVTCTADHPPEKFFSLPHRKKVREDRERRNSDDSAPEGKSKTSLGRSTSDVSSKRKERTSLSTLFRRAQKNKTAVPPVIVETKPNVVVKRSKSDVSDLKSNTNLNAQTKPIRKRSGSETEEFLKSLRNKKTQLSPIIESSPREDYFKKTPPLEVFQKQKLAQKDSCKSKEVSQTSNNNKVNPVEKPPRYKTPEKSEPKPPTRTKRGKSSEKEKESSITETPKRATEVKKTLFVDEIDTFKAKDPIEVKGKIKESIRKIEENVYGSRDMIHSSQKPPDKPPLTRGQTVDHIVKILNEDQSSSPPPPHLISPTNKTNVNQPFSYTKPSVNPDPNLFVRNTSPDRVPTPVNAMNDKGVVYAHVVRDNGETGSSNLGKQTIHKTYSPSREKYGNLSDEDEGLGYEERHKYTNKYDYDYKNNESDNFNSFEGPKIIDSPIRPRFKEYKITNFDEFEPTYANEYPSGKGKSPEFDEVFRGRGDGMDTKKSFEVDVDFNELSHRRQLLESKINSRRTERERIVGEPISRYLAETDPIYEAEKRMKATEKYVNETARYIHNTLERDVYTESSITEDYNRYDAHDHKIKYNTESRAYHKGSKREYDRQEYIDSLEPRYKNDKTFPPEPEYEPPSLEFNTGKPILSPDEYKEKKYKVKKHFTSSHDITQSGQKYKGRDEWFGKRKGHYASNPEIAQEREEDYAKIRNNAKQAEAYHNSLRRVRNKDKYKEDYGIRRHDSGDSREYYRDDRSPRRFEIDNRLVDSGIENDFRKDSSGEIHRKYHRHESDDDVRNTSLFLANERRHTEDNYPSEQIYANGEYLTRFKDYRDDSYRKEYSRDRNDDDYDPKVDRYERSPNDDKVSAKPPKAKKLSGLEKMKQLFSRDSSKKSKKEKEAVQQKARTRVLKSPEHLAQDDSEYRRFTDPEPSDIEVKKKYYEPEEDRRYKSSREDLDRHRSSREDLDRDRSSREDLDQSGGSRENLGRHRTRNDLSRHRSPREEDNYRGSREDVDRYKNSREDLRYRSSDPRDSDFERKYRERDIESHNRTLKKERRYTERKEEVRRYNSSDRDSDLVRSSDVESDRRKTRSRTAGPLDSPALAERNRERRRLATPSPTPSPPRRQPAPPPTSAGNWFKSLDRFTYKKKKVKDVAVEKESVLTNDDDPRKAWSKSKTLNSPAKNLRFFGDTDMDSDSNIKTAVTKTRSHPNSHSTLKKTTSNSSAGIDEIDHQMNKSYSLTNLQEKNDSPRSKYFKRNLQNISELHSNSENESNIDRSRASKPPISPYDRRSRSQSSSKTLKGSKSDLRKRNDERGSSTELRNSKQELRDFKHRRRTPAHNSGGSSTEGESSHQSQRSVVYLHATTVGDIPDPGHLLRNRSRDDVSSVNSSNLQVRSTTKSFSIFAPWTPRHYPDYQDVHYTTKSRKSKAREVKTIARNAAEDDRTPTPLKKKSYSQSTLTRKPQSTNHNHRLTSSNTSLYKKPERKENSSVLNSTISRKSMARDKKSQSNEVLNKENRSISRSLSMPKDKKAGWFRLSNKKKTENSRVR